MSRSKKETCLTSPEPATELLKYATSKRARRQHEIDDYIDDDHDDNFGDEQDDLLSSLKALRKSSSASKPTLVAQNDSQQLAFIGKTLLWSKGMSIHRVLNTQDDIVDAAFVSFQNYANTYDNENKNIDNNPNIQKPPDSYSAQERKRLFGPFIDPHPPRWVDQENSRRNPVPDVPRPPLLHALCIAHPYSIQLYCEDGSEFAIQAPSSISRIFSARPGNGLFIHPSDFKRPVAFYSLKSPVDVFTRVDQSYYSFDAQTHSLVHFENEIVVVMNKQSLQDNNSQQQQQQQQQQQNHGSLLTAYQICPVASNQANDNDFQDYHPHPRSSMHHQQQSFLPETEQKRGSRRRSSLFQRTPASTSSWAEPPTTSEHSLLAREANDTIIWENNSQSTNNPSALETSFSRFGHSKFDYKLHQIFSFPWPTTSTSSPKCIFYNSTPTSLSIALVNQDDNENQNFALHFKSKDINDVWSLVNTSKLSPNFSFQDAKSVFASRSHINVSDLLAYDSKNKNHILELRHDIQIPYCHSQINGPSCPSPLAIPPGTVRDVLHALSYTPSVDLPKVLSLLYGASDSFTLSQLEHVLVKGARLNPQNLKAHSDASFNLISSQSLGDPVLRSLLLRKRNRLPNTLFDKENYISKEKLINVHGLQSVHLIYQELCLTSDRLVDANHVGRIAAHLAIELSTDRDCARLWLDFYRRQGIQFDDSPLNNLPLKTTSSSSFNDDNDNVIAFFSNPPPDIYSALRENLAKSLDSNNTSASSEYPLLSPPKDPLFGQVDVQPITRAVLDITRKYLHNRTALVSYLVRKLNWSIDNINRLGFGLSTIINEILRSCKLSPPSSAYNSWGKAEFYLIGREDLAALYDPDQQSSHPPSSPAGQTKKQKQKPLQNQVLQFVTRFGADLRVREVEKILQSSSRVTLKVSEKRGLSEHNLALEHQGLVNAVSNRTLALPMGQAAFNFRTNENKSHEPVVVPEFCFEVRLLPDDSLWSPEPYFLTPDRLVWPDFHAGVATALKLIPHPDRFDAAELALNTPTELNSRHAGFLFGLGLNQSLRSLAVYQAYPYLNDKHQETSIGLLLGLSSAYAGTCDTKVANVLIVHIPALLPPSSISLHLPLLTQTGALLGLGILNIGSGKRSYADAMIKELLKITIVGTRSVDDCREAYALAAGYAFGMIMLGKGPELGMSLNSSVLSQFKLILQGGDRTNLPGDPNRYKAIDVEVTSPAATIALGLAFFGHEDRYEILDLLELPTSILALEYIRPDLILLRSLCRCLIQWNLVQPTEKWINSCLPKFILDYISQRASSKYTSPSVADDIEVAYWNIITGTCLAIGIKYAGTAKEEAHTALIGFVDRLIKAFSHKGHGLKHKLKMASLRNCISVLLLALASLMAGTGELHVLRRLRMFHGQVGDPLDYGSHMATHLAIGLLFLGGGRYTLSSSPASVAFLVCAFYPILPLGSHDNRAHLQAARHLWALALEPRCLFGKDATTGEIVYLPVKLRIRENNNVNVLTGNGNTGNGDGDGGGEGHNTSLSSSNVHSQQLVCPTLIPDINSIDRIRIDTPRYWPVVLDLRRNPKHREALFRTRTLLVKRRAGHLSYVHDSRGTQNLFTRSKAESAAVVLNCSKTVGMMLASLAARPGLQHFLTALSPDAKIAGAIRYLVGWDSKGNDLVSSDSPAEVSRFSFSSNGNGIKDHHQQLQDKALDDMNAFNAFCASVLMECLTQDKGDIMPLYHIMYLLQLYCPSSGSESSNYNSKRDARTVVDFFSIQGINNLNLLFALYDNPNEHQNIFGGRTGKSSSSTNQANQTLINRLFLESIRTTFDNLALSNQTRLYFAYYFWTLPPLPSSMIQKFDSPPTDFCINDSNLSLILTEAECPPAQQLIRLRDLVVNEINKSVQPSSITPDLITQTGKVVELLVCKSFVALGMRPKFAGPLSVSVSELYIQETLKSI